MTKTRVSQWDGLEVGMTVRCADPDGFLSEVARKLRNRSGEIVRFQMFSGAPIIEFPATGRRKAFQWVPPRRSDIEVQP